MKKFSRMHGWMSLRAYDAGDGSMGFVWSKAGVDYGEPLNETVTESDVSEYLRGPGMKKKWKDWDIIDLGSNRSIIRLARNVERHCNASGKLGNIEMAGWVYSYKCNKDSTNNSTGWVRFWHDATTTEFFIGKKRVGDAGNVIQSLCFFLNYENKFENRDKQRQRGENKCETK